MNRFAVVASSLFAMLLVALVLAATDKLVVTLSVLLTVFAGILFGVFLNGLSDFLARYSPLPYQAAFAVVVGILLILASVGVFYLGAQIAQRADELWSQLETAAQNGIDRLNQAESSRPYLPDVSEMREMVASRSGDALPKVFQGLMSLSWALTSGLVIFFVGLYAAVDPQLYRRGMIKLVPTVHRGRIREVLDRLRDALRQWIIGRFMSMTIIGILTGIGLWFLDVPLPITLGVVAALFTFIPNVGPLLAAVPQVLLALNVSANTAIYVAIFNVVLQGVESYLITPVIQRHEVSLPPILTIAAQLLMGALVGVIGIMMAAPLIVVAMVLIQMLYIQDQLGDPNAGELTST